MIGGLIGVVVAVVMCAVVYGIAGGEDVPELGGAVIVI